MKIQCPSRNMTSVLRERQNMPVPSMEEDAQAHIVSHFLPGRSINDDQCSRWRVERVESGEERRVE
jgi:hypothetical protein